MTSSIFFILTLLSALGCGLMAGIFFIFSNTVMRALEQLQPPKGIAAMQSINTVILNPLFFLVFIGTAVISVLLAVSLVWMWSQPSSIYILFGVICYLVGSFLVTIVFNVPMNKALDKVKPDTIEATNLWAKYLTNWTAWNHVRTIACFLGSIFFTLSL